MNKSAVISSLLVIALAAFVAGRYSSAPRSSSSANRRLLYYVDPMPPAFHSDRPGIAPDCGMPLEPVYEGTDPTAVLSLPAGSLSIPVEQQQIIGVRVET